MPKILPQGYSRLQIRLHWAVVLLILIQYLFGEAVSHAFGQAMRDGTVPALTLPVVFHFVVGTLMFLLAAWRLLLRRERGAPAPPDEDPGWQKTAALVTHWALYTLLLVLPLIGAVGWAMAAPAAANLHGFLFNVLVALALLHVAGGLYGHFVQKTGVLDRMRTPSD